MKKVLDITSWSKYNLIILTNLNMSTRMNSEMTQKDMTKSDSTQMGARGPTGVASCCKIHSIVTVDERGQMVLPKEIRDQAEIRPGDRISCWMQ
jgi:hypothetical protein